VSELAEHLERVLDSEEKNFAFVNAAAYRELATQPMR
jgi:hypothetical protein